MDSAKQERGIRKKVVGFNGVSGGRKDRDKRTAMEFAWGEEEQETVDGSGGHRADMST